MPRSRLLALTAFSGLLAVVLGALGAHAWRDRLMGAAEAWRTASTYHLAHTVAALAVLAWAASRPPDTAGSLRRVAGWWLAGCLLFSGSIYALALCGPRWLGPVTPIGGLAWMVGWTLLAIEAWRDRHSPARD